VSQPGIATEHVVQDPPPELTTQFEEQVRQVVPLEHVAQLGIADEHVEQVPPAFL